MSPDAVIRIGQAAELLDVSVETIRRWERRQDPDRAVLRRPAVVPLSEVGRILGDRRADKQGDLSADLAQSSRNRFSGIVTRIERDKVAAVVEVQCGPHRLVSLMTAEAVDDCSVFAVGDEAVCSREGDERRGRGPRVMRFWCRPWCSPRS